jgi:hypothetical protein
MKTKRSLRRTVHAPNDGDDKYLNTVFECTSPTQAVLVRLHWFKIVLCVLFALSGLLYRVT